MLKIKHIIKTCDFSMNKNHKMQLLNRLLEIIDLQNSLFTHKEAVKQNKDK